MTTLNSLFNYLDEKHHELFKYLNNGATRQDIEATERQLNISYPSGLKDAYLLHNGQREGWPRPGIFPGFFFLTLREAVQQYLKYMDWRKEWDESELVGLDAWTPQMIPFGACENGDVLVYDLRNEQVAEVTYTPPIAKRYDSLGAYADFIVQGIETDRTLVVEMPTCGVVEDC